MLIYEGPSELDKKTIIQAILLFDSSNDKTGDKGRNMAQLHIVVKDEAPHVAQKSGKDAAVCGSCPQRPLNGGGCYVVTGQGPNSTWKAHKNREVENLRGLYQPLRFGAYGDPLALPRHVLENLLSKCKYGWTGYTHQWGKARFQWASSFLMASTESEKSLNLAKRKGWKVFHIVDEENKHNEIQLCDNSVNGTKCIDCLKCDGLHNDIKIVSHGSKKKKATK